MQTKIDNPGSLSKRMYEYKPCSSRISRIDSQRTSDEIGNGTADRQSQTGTLFELVHLHKTVEDALLFFQGITICIFLSFRSRKVRSCLRSGEKPPDNLLQIDNIGPMPGYIWRSNSSISSIFYFRITYWKYSYSATSLPPLPTGSGGQHNLSSALRRSNRS